MPRNERNCPPDEQGVQPAPRGVQYFNTRRVVYSLNDPAAPASWLQPVRTVDLLTAANDRDDVQHAFVSLHTRAMVREGGPIAPLTVPEASTLVTLDNREPPVAYTGPIAAPPQRPDVRNTGNGVAEPKYRILFRDGTDQAQALFVDGNCTLCLPANQVEVELLVTDGALVDPAAGTEYPPPQNGVHVDAIASASVAWASRGKSAAPQGATYTQTNVVTQGIPGTTLQMFFERPPYAHAACIVWDRALQSGGVVLAVADFMVSDTETLGAAPQGVVLGSDLEQQAGSFCVPGPCTHIRIDPDNAATIGAKVSVVWLIGGF